MSEADCYAEKIFKTKSRNKTHDTD